MHIQLDRKSNKFASFKYEITDNKNIVNGNYISFSKPNRGCAIKAYGKIENLETEFTIFNKYLDKVKINGITKEYCAGYRIGNELGKIFYCGKKGSNFLNGIYFWSFEMLEQIVEAYEVGFGRKGIYLCLWSNNSLIAVISKKMHTKNFESSYQIFAENIDEIPLLTIATSFWDITRYFNTTSGEEWHILNTWQKELKNKFDPSFISRIKAMEDIND